MNSSFNIDYRGYVSSIKTISKDIGIGLNTNFTIVPTSKKICRRNGINKERKNSIGTARFLEKVYELLQKKGYKIPNIYISEENLPREYNISGLQQGNYNIFGPGRLDVSSPALIIHEEGHYLHKKNMVWNQGLYSMFCSIRNIFRPFLNNNEKQILTNDIKRAYSEGYYDNLQLDKCIQKGYIDKETAEKFKKTPEQYLIKNFTKNVSEFIAEYFQLAARGFEFSKEISNRYKYFNGPEIKEIISKKEEKALMSYKNKLEINI